MADKKNSKITQLVNDYKSLMESANDDNIAEWANNPLLVNGKKDLSGFSNEEKSKIWNLMRKAENYRNNPGNNKPVTQGEQGKQIIDPAEEVISSVKGKYNWASDQNAKKAAEKTEKDAQTRQFDTKKGHTGNKYIDFGTLRKEKELAERNLREVESENKTLQNYKDKLEYYKQLSDNIRKSAKDGSGEINLEEENKKLQAVNERISFLEGAISSMANPWMKDAPFSNPEDEKKWKELNKECAELSGQIPLIKDRIKRGESFQELKKPLIGFTHDLMGVVDKSVKNFGEWAKKDGSQVNEYQAQIAQNIYNKINKVLEDGKITFKEARAIEKLNIDIGNLIEEERKKDPKIMDAEDRVKSASARQGYFLFDQIKSLAVLLVGLSQGNASMVYSAMDMFNKKIADAEAGYTADEIKAFSNNNVKDITGLADVQYLFEQSKGELEKKIAEMRLSEAERAIKVKELESAFEEYQNYVEGGGNLGFAAWFWANVKAGGSWSDLVKEAISTFTQGPDSPTDPKQKRGKDVSYNFNTSGNTERLAQNILGTVKKEAEKGQQTKKLRDVQNTVNNAVASRMGGQGAAPQGVGNAAPINTSWGRA